LDYQGKHITILGKAMSGRECPFDADETWGVNNVFSQELPCNVCKGEGKVKTVPLGMANKPEGTETPCEKCKGTGRVNQFEGKKVHKLFAFDLLPKEYTDEMKKFAPVVSWQDYADEKYPLQEVLSEFKTRYFTNTISYMIALAIYYKVKKLSIYGCDLSFGAPYAQENRGIEYWIGRALERGIEVYTPPSAHILRTCYGNLYGEQNECNLLMYLHERLGLINLLPQQGHYSDALKRQNAWWVLFPKEDEAKVHQLQVTKDPMGHLSFNTPAEYTSDVQMPPEVWKYISELLKELESKGELPFSLIALYEKLVLSRESTK
jgi:hypothetical protein